MSVAGTELVAGVIRRNPEPVTADAINVEHRLVLQSANDFMQHAIRCGELLLAKKAELEHGEFMPWVKAECEFAYSTAARYIKAANQSSTGVEISSLSQLFPSGRHAQSHRTETSGNQEWYTPPEHVGAAGVDTDVVAKNQRIRRLLSSRAAQDRSSRYVGSVVFDIVSLVESLQRMSECGIDVNKVDAAFAKDLADMLSEAIKSLPLIRRLRDELFARAEAAARDTA